MLVVNPIMYGEGNSPKGMNIYSVGYLDGNHTWITPVEGDYRVICIGRGQDGQVGNIVDSYGNNSGAGGNSGSWCEKKFHFKRGQGGSIKIDDVGSSFYNADVLLKAEHGKSSGVAIAVGGDTNHNGLLGKKGGYGEAFGEVYSIDDYNLRAPSPGTDYFARGGDGAEAPDCLELPNYLNYTYGKGGLKDVSKVEDLNNLENLNGKSPEALLLLFPAFCAGGGGAGNIGQRSVDNTSGGEPVPSMVTGKGGKGGLAAVIIEYII